MMPVESTHSIPSGEQRTEGWSPPDASLERIPPGEETLAAPTRGQPH